MHAETIYIDYLRCLRKNNKRLFNAGLSTIQIYRYKSRITKAYINYLQEYKNINIYTIYLSLFMPHYILKDTINKRLNENIFTNINLKNNWEGDYININ